MRRAPLTAPQSEAKPRSARQFAPFPVALGFLIGLLLGLAFSWAQGALPESNTEPRQLNDDAHALYMVAIALDYQHGGDLRGALEKLIPLAPGRDPFQAVADAACQLFRNGNLETTGGARALRALVALYREQGRSGCADSLAPEQSRVAPDVIASPAKPDSLDTTPLPTKTPPGQPPQPTATLRVVATALPRRAFAPLPARTFCDPDSPALIAVYVVDYLGRGIPAQRIRVRWGNHEDVFVSGLKPERGDGYADFQMAPNVGYIIDMPGASVALGAELSTGVCYAGNRETLKSWRVTFRESS